MCIIYVFVCMYLCIYMYHLHIIFCTDGLSSVISYYSTFCTLDLYGRRSFVMSYYSTSCTLDLLSNNDSIIRQQVQCAGSPVCSSVSMNILKLLHTLVCTYYSYCTLDSITDDESLTYLSYCDTNLSYCDTNFTYFTYSS
jgi:hypothetical protein